MNSIFFLLSSVLLSPTVFGLSIVTTVLGELGLRAMFDDDLINDSPCRDGLPPADDSLTYHPQKQR